MQPSKLVFVYNADGGLLNAAKDSWQKFTEPENYDCKLCALTYGFFSENKKWKQFRKKASAEMDFLHRDEFKQQYASKFSAKFELPVVLEENPNEGLQLLVSKAELNGMEKVEELIDLLKKRKPG